MEIWKTILNHPNYEVSNFGQVRKADFILTPRVHSGGYHFVQLNGKERYIHRLIIESFVATIPKGWVVNHLDGNPANNSLNNLEICTPWENSQHHFHPVWYSSQIRILPFLEVDKTYKPKNYDLV